LIRKEAVYGMKPGAVIVDIAAESGGNCELTVPGETVLVNGVKIVGPLNLASTLSYHASEMYSRNLYNLIKPALDKGVFNIDWTDEVFAGCALTHAGAVRHEPTRKLIDG
jgi:NAD(P) transhydrogenase subunit alpha